MAHALRTTHHNSQKRWDGDIEERKDRFVMIVPPFPFVMPSVSAHTFHKKSGLYSNFLFRRSLALASRSKGGAQTLRGMHGMLTRHAKKHKKQTNSATHKVKDRRTRTRVTPHRCIPHTRAHVGFFKSATIARCTVTPVSGTGNHMHTVPSRKTPASVAGSVRYDAIPYDVLEGW